MNYEDLTPEQREMAKSCSTPEELLELSRKIGYELSEDELDAVSGGANSSWSCWANECPPDCRGYCARVCAVGSTSSSEAGREVGYT